MLRLLAFLILISPLTSVRANAQVVRNTWQKTADAHAKVDKNIASFFAGECAAVPRKGETEAAALEKIYFPAAAKKLLKVDQCEKIALGKLITAGYSGHFVNKVTLDIAVKLPMMRELAQKIAKLKSDLSEMNKENDAYDRQNARVGYVAPYQIVARQLLNRKMSDVENELKAPTAAFKTLTGSVWRAEDSRMQRYLSNAIGARISPKDFLNEARQPQHSWASRTLWGNYSFLDAVIKPMIEDAIQLDHQLLSQFEKQNGLWTFYPTFATRKLLTENMDLLYDPDEPTPEFTNLACRLDQEYSKGDDDLGTLISVGTLLVGPAGRLVPWALRSVKLGRLVEGRNLITTSLAAMDKVTAGSMFFQTAQAAYEACTSKYDHVHNAVTVCSDDVTIEEIDNYQSRLIDRDNCATWVAATAMNERNVGNATKQVGALFAAHPEIAANVEQARQAATAAFHYKDSGMSVKYNSETGKDLIDMMMNKKDDDDSGDDKDKAEAAKPDDDSKDDKDSDDDK